jgi:hypothetical protein
MKFTKIVLWIALILTVSVSCNIKIDQTNNDTADQPKLEGTAADSVIGNEPPELDGTIDVPLDTVAIN